MRDTFDRFQAPDRGRFGDNEAAPARSRGPRVTGASDLVDIDLVFRGETAKALKLTKPNDPIEKAFWLPKSQIEFVRGDGALVRVSLPEWLAIDKGLV